MIQYIEKGIGLHAAIESAGHMLYILDGVWVSSDDVAVQAIIDGYHPPLPDPKMVGIEFDGTMCSATKDDQSGLMAVLTAIQIQGAGFKPTRFEFENGAVLVISLSNYQAFLQTWLPFRQSFFAV